MSKLIIRFIRFIETICGKALGKNRKRIDGVMYHADVDG